MAKILYAPGIEEVSGALSKIKTKSQHSHDQNMFLAVHRVAPTMNKTCSRAYFRKINSLPWQNSFDPSQEVLTLREEFVFKSRAVAARKKSLATLASDQAVFLELNQELMEKTGVKGTFKVFYWACAKKYYSNGSVNWPAGGIDLTYEEYRTACMSARDRE